MKTRIKTEEYLNGRLAFYPQFRKYFLWWDLRDSSNTFSGIGVRSESRSAAQKRIDKFIRDKEFWYSHDTKKSVKYDYEDKGK